jgi:hypothetical protein
MSPGNCTHDLYKPACAICSPRTGCALPSISEWESAHPGADLNDLATSFVLELDDRAMRRLLIEFVVARMADDRRARVRRAEQRAQTEAWRSQETARRAGMTDEERAEKRARNVACDAEYARRPWSAPSYTKAARNFRSLSQAEQIKRRTAEDREFAEYVNAMSGCGITMAGFSLWRMGRHIEEFEAATRRELLLELTDELMSSTFSLGDGSSVAWGEASVGQHQQRFDMLMAQAGGNLQTAQRHMAAVKLMEENGAACLKEIAGKAAA